MCICSKKKLFLSVFSLFWIFFGFFWYFFLIFVFSSLFLHSFWRWTRLTKCSEMNLSLCTRGETSSLFVQNVDYTVNPVCAWLSSTTGYPIAYQRTSSIWFLNRKKKPWKTVHVTIEPVLIHFFSRTPAFVHVCVFFVFEIDYLISNLHGFFQSQILSIYSIDISRLLKNNHAVTLLAAEPIDKLVQLPDKFPLPDKFALRWL